MKVEDYFLSLTKELEALKDRIRYLIDDQHWQTDGEWKESVVRQVLRRHLPASIGVGRGFVVTADKVTHQLDVLIFDISKPMLFRDGDLVFITPDAVIGVIEVKSHATPTIISQAATKLASDMAIVRENGGYKAFAGIFAFEGDSGTPETYLHAIGKSSKRSVNRVDFTNIGCSRFIRYWELDPEEEKHFYNGWHSYLLPNTAAGYFFHNVIDAVSPSSVLWNRGLWFPVDGEKSYRDGEFLGTWPCQRPKQTKD